MRFFGILTAFLVALVHVESRASELVVTGSDASRLSVRWTLDRPEYLSVSDGSKRYRVPTCDGAFSVAEPGQPDLQAIVRLIALPPSGEARIRVVSVATEQEIVDDLAPAPAEFFDDSGTGNVVVERAFSEATRRGDGAPRPWARITGGGWIRGTRIARLELHPFRWDMGSGALTWATELRVDVEFPDGDAGGFVDLPDRGDSRAWETALGGSLLNGDVASRWRTTEVVHAGRGGGDSFSSSPNWLRVPITAGGVYRVDYFTFANLGVDPGGIDPNSVRVFAGTNLALREDVSAAAPQFMTECALLDLGDADTIFDLNDRFLFYALGTSGWGSEYDPTRSRTEHIDHQYVDRTFYWITWGGSFSSPPRRMASRAVPPGAGPFAQTSPYRLHYEENNVDDYRVTTEDGWFWEDLFGRGLDRLYFLDADRVAGGAGVLTVRVCSHGGTTGAERNKREVELKVGTQPIAQRNWNHTTTVATQDITGCFDSGLASGANTIRLNVTTVSDSALDRVYTAWFDLEYERHLTAKSGSYLKFFAEPTPPTGVDAGCAMFPLYGRSDFLLSGFDASPAETYLFDVTDQHGVQRLTDYAVTAAVPPHGIQFSDPGHPETRWYVATTMEGVLPLPAAEIVNFPDLRNAQNSGEYVIIYHPRFEEGAARLAAIRRDLSWRPRSTMIVDVTDVYNEFSWGLEDPTAIRDFLRHAFLAWTGDRPLYVVLIGDTSFDQKRYLAGSPENLLATYLNRYRTEASVQYVSSDNVNFYATDDYYGYLEELDYTSGMQPALDVAIGRYPVALTEDLEVMLDKLDSYVSYSMPGQWQNRIILMADDERVLDPNAREPFHTQQLEALASTRVPPPLDPVKVYLTEYPRNEFNRKPEAQAAFIEEYTRGALMTTYTGHGDQNTLAQEEGFVSQRIPDLLNEERYTVFSTFSCTVSRFDILAGDSMTERMLKHPDGGAVTTFASSGLVFPNESAPLNEAWLGEMFGTPYIVGTYARSVRPIGIAALMAKVLLATTAPQRRNNEKYVTLGDPALEVRFGRHLVEFEAATVDSQTTDGLLRVVRGAVVDSVGNVLDGTNGVPAFSGRAFVHVTEGADSSGYSYDSGHIDYVLDGPTSFRGEVPVEDGRFEAKFFLADAVTPGNSGRISVFALEDGLARDGSGAYSDLVIAPTISPDLVDDSEGPHIRIRFEGYDNFVEGDFLFTSRPVLLVDLEDESGVNLRPTPQFARLEAQIDGRERVDLGEDFSYSVGSFTQGTVRRLLQFSAGEHTLEIKAFDNVSNRNSLTTKFTIVLPSADFDLVDQFVAAYPNPFENRTDLLYRLTHPADVSIKIFTITGRKIYEMDSILASGGENRFSWNGTDQSGGPLANGTYLYKLEATYTDAEGRRSTDGHVGKVVKMR